MNRLTYTTLIIIFGLVVGFMLLLVAGGYIFEGETAMGVALLWYYSLPVVLLLGYLVARASYKWYASQTDVLIQTMSLLGIAFSVAVIPPVIVYFAMWVLLLW